MYPCGATAGNAAGPFLAAAFEILCVADGDWGRIWQGRWRQSGTAIGRPVARRFLHRTVMPGRPDAQAALFVIVEIPDRCAGHAPPGLSAKAKQV